MLCRSQIWWLHDLDFLHEALHIDISVAHPIVADFLQIVIQNMKFLQVKFGSSLNESVDRFDEFIHHFWAIEMFHDIIHQVDDSDLRRLIFSLNFVYFVD